jgi:hypothetical protein
MIGQKNKFIRIPYNGKPCLYLRLSDIESIETSAAESPEDSNERKPGSFYRAKVLFRTRSGQDAEVTFGIDTNRQINLKKLLKKWAICL